MTTKTMVAHFELKALDDEAHSFEGLASTWDLDLGGDVIKPGAFKRTLQSWKKAKGHVPLLDSHNAFSTVRSVVGRMEEGEETDEGLVGTFSMIPDDADAEGVFKRIKGGYVSGMSIGYEAVEVEYPKTEDERKAGIYRYLKQVKLREISVVLFPMNPQARIDMTTAKSLLIASKDRDLDKEEVMELTALHAQIGDLLKAQGDAPSPEEALADPTKAADLVAKIDSLFASGLATRIEAAQHSGSAVLVGL